MVDLGGYVIILVETKDKKIKLYGKSFVCIILGFSIVFVVETLKLISKTVVMEQVDS